jgi:hypothetical protein
MASHGSLHSAIAIGWLTPPRRSIRIKRALAFVLGLLSVCPAALHAEGNWFEGGESRAWLRSYDPTLIGRRVVTEFSFEDDRDGITITKLSTTVRGSTLIGHGLAVGAQVELPVEWHSTNGDIVSGLADFETRAGVVGRINKTLRWGTALNLKFPTATDPVLSDPFTMKPLLAISWDVTSALNLGLTPSYEFTPGAPSSDQVNTLHFDVPVAVSLSKQWSAAATYKPEWNLDARQFTHKLETGVTLLFGPDSQFALSTAVEIPLSRQTLEWKAIASLAWYF